MSIPDFEKCAKDFLEAASEYSQALLDEATSFLRAKVADDKCTDGKAREMALVETGGASIMAAARMEVAKMRLARAANGIAEAPRLN